MANGSRKITSITEVTGMEGDMLVTQEIFRYRGGAFEATGIVSRALAPEAA
jgi:Flp pilus assembly CpaF family ATPase